MVAPQGTVKFSFMDPTAALVRLLLCSPLAQDVANMAFHPEPDSRNYDDFCNGEKWARIQRALPVGAAALPAVLFFDELNQDEKGFATAEGILLVGGFFRRAARESTHAKLAIGSFPPVQFPRVTAQGPPPTQPFSHRTYPPTRTCARSATSGGWRSRISSATCGTPR